MPWSYPDNIPSILKNKPVDVQKECIKVGNATLEKTGDEQSAIFAMQACVKRVTKSNIPLKPQESLSKQFSKPVPSHVSTLIQKAREEAIQPVTEDLQAEDISRELIDVKLNTQDELVHKFDDGSTIKTDLSRLSKKHITQNVAVSSSNPEVFINQQPELNYPAISYSLVEGTGYYTQSVNVP